MKNLRSGIKGVLFWILVTAILNSVQTYNSYRLEKRIASLETISYEKPR